MYSDLSVYGAPIVANVVGNTDFFNEWKDEMEMMAERIKSNSQLKYGSTQDSMEGEATQNGNNVHGSQNGKPNTNDSVINQSMADVPIQLLRVPLLT
ncbi:bZIP transcription factor 16 [Artemisia annua]|uniref:BZIP transcription factor 16 n=1 Tax=Artemisia annua TaxID=35608 RepID=A0A2U1N7Z0_ARTAN|nr:bZIP transcription factor 16 [Artemisia annua]